jgi:YceI-like domain
MSRRSIWVAWLLGLLLVAAGLKARATTDGPGLLARVANGGDGAEGLAVDPDRSTLTVFVYKSGLFSAFADDHIIDAAIANGSIADQPPLSVAIEVRARELRVRDPNLSASKRAEVQTRMLGPEVLDVEKFPSITFESTAIEPAGPDRWKVAGQLTIHGQTRAVSFPVNRANGRYRGSLALKQRDFAITPITIAGGTVKVKDELKIEFDIVGRAR